MSLDSLQYQHSRYVENRRTESPRWCPHQASDRAVIPIQPCVALYFAYLIQPRSSLPEESDGHPKALSVRWLSRHVREERVWRCMRTAEWLETRRVSRGTAEA